MAILVDENTRVLCQGMTGWAGSHHTAEMIAYGTKVVAGVTPGKGGRFHLGLPVFDTVAEAMTATQANASMLFVPPDNAAAAMIEAIEAEMPLIVAITERVPVLDMLRVRDALKGSKTILVGPNSQGVLAPGVCKIGVMATGPERRGHVGIISRSASLTSEVIAQVSAAGLGQSTTVGVGGDAVHGLGMRESLEMFLKDPETHGIVLIGEIGGNEEEEVADFVKQVRPSIPIVALVVGRNAPPERRMGHAGALNQAGRGDAESKIKALSGAGVIIAPSPHLVGETIRQSLASKAA
ncbi:Succinyl-CoA ligase [ADP-forming] subunit alpha [Hartmannibacter diazotrophicus]|uniref:Succinyl-CoA ligase [ADP-forming] subunit alpha n=1 Tax=Hartmannibacter diazotrophicus TaxID=1482074 RepID=A0A2C9DC40_9HYPH|nr:succinate--CoA ligase subunit alpha [Hartmannibacter diazotrophicus]SON57698.1 Succinyl-CoA ligase [ADP-forming] subunit alpha [Hartmannibacter diazotrophicus]